VRGALSTATIVALIALLAGAASAQQDTAGHYCAKTGAIRFRAADGTRLEGHRFGRGTTAVIFAHEVLGGACRWIPYARQFARLGYLTIAFDFRGYGHSQRRYGTAGLRLPSDVIAAARKARSLGATKVVLVGASMGGTAVLVAAARANPAVDGIISLSAPSTFGRMDGLAAARRLQAPILYIAGARDDGFPDDARILYEATASGDKSLEILDTSAHGILLASEPAARSLIERFVASH
jgi:pimeloyl-ACP methyl ester carboxylesterase